MAGRLQARPGGCRCGDALFKGLTVLCASLVAVVIVGMFAQLVLDAEPSIRRFGFGFLVSREWNPVRGEFGAASSVFGTVVSTLIAMLLATPVALVIALLLVELAPATLSRVVGTGIELLAAVPSIIYGMWGLFVLAPLMQDHVQPFLASKLGWVPGVDWLFEGVPMGIGMLTAGVILALMVLPFITAVARDSLAMVPAVVKEAAHGMGSTTWEATRRVSLRYCRRGIAGAIFLGFGRAVGETMAVTFVIGNSNRISSSLFAPGNTIASKLANEFAEADGSLHVSALVELALVLFVLTFAFQVLAQWWLGRQAQSAGAHP
jgi:phosphate transport system permease protein